MDPVEPPRFARWLLEHCSAPGRDAALDGDLLEELRAGRSADWYRRQVMSALAVGWMRALSTRGMLVLFAALWSMLAPAWTAILDRLVSRPNPAEAFWRMDAVFSGVSSFSLWLGLNVVFVWFGLALYFVSLTRVSRAFRRNDVVRAFVAAVPVFLLAYFGTFVAMNLLVYPGPTLPRRTMTPGGEIFDLRLAALALRIPYFVTLVCVLWEARPHYVWSGHEALPLAPADLQSDDPPAMFQNRQSDHTPASLVRFLVLAGLVNTLIVAVLLCRLPASHTPSLRSVLARAAIYVILGALAGTAGAWAYWRRAASSGARLPVPFGLFALLCAAGWVWVPAVVLLAAQEAPAAAFIAALAAVLLAVGLRRAVPLPLEAPDIEAEELFAATLRHPKREMQGYVIAGCIYLAGFALNNHEHLAASGLLALSVFLFAWQLTLVPPRAVHPRDSRRRATWRLARIAVPAVLVTLWALLDGVAHRDRFGDGNTASAHGSAAGGTEGKAAPTDASAALDGYESIVLWPEPPKKQILAPVPPALQPRDPRLTKPLILRFNGAYWYFQPPSSHPGPHAHVTHGSPLAVDIHSTTFIPLTMEAHQNLARPLRLACCGSIAVEIENRDNRPGPLGLAMILTDNTAPGKPSIYLGQQPIASSLPDRFHIKSTPVTETLHFVLPSRAPLRRFDEITLIIVSDPMRIDMGARLGIAQFELDPR
jgi:hypothetical protein